MSTVESANPDTPTEAPVEQTRLDDFFRYAVHTRPEVVIDLIAPELLQGVRSADSPVRLDTQLAPVPYLPDAAYLITNPSSPTILVLEGQSRAPRIVPDRASTITISLGTALRPRPPRVEVRLIELRTRQRCRNPGRRRDDAAGRIYFEPMNTLLDLDPRDPRFGDPTTWPLLAFSRRADAELLDNLLSQMNELFKPDHPLYSTVDATDAHLLGAISRARFPDYAWSTPAQESIVNETQNIESSNVGFLTQDERRELQAQANQRVRIDLAKLKAEKLEEGEKIGLKRGEEIGERKALMDMAAAIAPAEFTRLNEIEALDNLRREVMALLEGMR